MTTLILTNACLVLPDRVIPGAVRIDDGLITEIHDDPAWSSPRHPAEDLAGDVLMPGIVELHTDQVEAHFQPRPQRFWDPIPAVIAHDAQLAASGMTTVFDALRIGAGPLDGNQMAAHARTLVRAVVRASEQGLLRADHFVHLRCEVSTADVVETFDAIGAHDRVRMVSLMDHTPGQRQYANVEAFRTYMVGKGRLTDESFDAHVATLHRLSSTYADTHRREMAERATARSITMAAHDDATREHVAESSELGVRVSEFPTTIDAARAAHEAGQYVLMGAPNVVRGGSHSGNVAATDLLTAGVLDILSSDYVPASPLQAVFQLVDRGVITLHEASRLVSANPAAAIGLTDRGEIAVGKRADVVRVRVHREDPGEDHPDGLTMPIVRGVWRTGTRVA